MTDEEALIAAIRANPKDLTARLAYADWLDERNDPRGEYLRLLCELADRDTDPEARLRELRTQIDYGWVESMQEGVTRGGLKFDSVFRLHCTIHLNDGKEICLQELHQHGTYMRGDGLPTRKNNDSHIEWVVRDARQRSFQGRVRLIDPPRRDYLNRPGDMARFTEPFRVPEWLPEVSCIGWFEAINTSLTIVWFQNEFAPPIAPSVLSQICALDWDREAAREE